PGGVRCSDHVAKDLVIAPRGVRCKARCGSLQRRL
ncbi:hypothetical protein A2U01_0091235, partial [Trifolium medium]|nr:hypothetical protein [Trifolium medium]